jgi:1,4-alpha-glucan branching enzyme
MNKTEVFTLFSDFDLELFASGFHSQLYEKFGAHPTKKDGKKGVYFSVYAPAAKEVSIIGDFNSWNGEEHKLFVQWNGTGIWEGFIPGLKINQLYKFRILSNHDNIVREKADPYARKCEMPPKSASVIATNDYKWKDAKWMKKRHMHNSLEAPYLVYEVHIGSWKKKEHGTRSLHYTELADELVSYVKEMGYTHVELMPVMEHPYYPSWGYLCTSYFAPTARYGDPEELKALVDAFHQADIGVILDWVPAHFPDDESALAMFDGSALYEHPDRAKGFHPDWNSLIFNFEREQIRSFLLSSAHFWLDEYHIDGLRVDAVASMLYLDYSREDGEWTPNIHGGNEYLAAIDFIKELNKSVYGRFPDVQMIAEESTAFSGVTRPVHEGGLGFGMKWMMGWMNDTLEYFSKDPIHRKYHQGDISRSLTYAFSENYVLPLSHDEVVHGKESIVTKMPGDEWQRFANTRLLYLYMYTHPGQKLLFMGNDIGQTTEWNVDESLPWHLLDYEPHKGLQQFIKSLNAFFKKEKTLYTDNYSPSGWEWIDYSDGENSVLAYIRKGGGEELIVVCNFTPRVMTDYRIGVNHKGTYEEVFNSDDPEFWGSSVNNKAGVESDSIRSHHRNESINLSIPPLGGIILKRKK